jgi:hypothetical protein
MIELSNLLECARLGAPGGSRRAGWGCAGPGGRPYIRLAGSNRAQKANPHVEGGA